jgi:mono/diheme cytochrome c family protein
LGIKQMKSTSSHDISWVSFPKTALALLCLALSLSFTLSACTTEGKLSDKATVSKGSTVKLTQVGAPTELAVKDDFGYPAQLPKLSNGKTVFAKNCASCHTAGKLSYSKIQNMRPVEAFLMLSRGDKHPAFRNLTRQQRWEAVFYHRFLSGGSTFSYNKQDLQGLYGSNCAVCHGKGGFADGPLHSGHASRHEMGMAPVKGAFYPPPANFHDYPRFYNRTDDVLVKHIAEGLYPSAMPPWLGRLDKDKQFVFDDKMIRELVFYVREFSFENDLPASEQPIAKGGPRAGQWPGGVSADEIHHAELKSAAALKIGGGGAR